MKPQFGSATYGSEAHCDEGQGLANDFDPEKTAGRGMKVVKTLAKQLGGTVLSISEIYHQAASSLGNSCFPRTYSI